MDISRRNFLKTLGSSALGLGALCAVGRAQATDNDFNDFMQFSGLITEENELDPEFGKLCWRYVKAHSQPAHIQAMKDYVLQPDQSTLQTNQDLRSIAHHTLLVWYKGDINSIHPTPEQIKIANIQALKWSAIGRPARGLCIPNWSQSCTTS